MIYENLAWFTVLWVRLLIVRRLWRAGHPRKRRAIYSRRAVGRMGLCRTERRGSRRGFIPAAQPHLPQQYAGKGGALQGGALRDRGRRLQFTAAYRARRLDLVYGFSRLDVSPGPGGHFGNTPSGPGIVGQSLHPQELGKLQVAYHEGETTFQIRVENASGVNRGVRQVTLDGKDLPGNEIPLLSDGGQHQAHVLMG